MSDTFDFSKAKRGPVIDAKGKTRITIMLDDDVLQAFRERAASEGKGYQTLINESLRNALKAGDEPDIALKLKQIFEFMAAETAVRERENAVLIGTIDDASETIGKVLHMAEHAGKKADFSRLELDRLRRAASAADFAREFIKAARPSKRSKNSRPVEG
jgi:plasmid stability protein